MTDPETRDLLMRALKLAKQVPQLHEYSYHMSRSDASGFVTPDTMRWCQLVMTEASALEREIGDALLTSPETWS